MTQIETRTKTFEVLEATVANVLDAYQSGELTARQLVEMYLQRIDAYDQEGPKLNVIITLNDRALEEADRLDRLLKRSGLAGPLHGIPILLKDQMDAVGMPTTLGSVIFKDYYPDRDSFVTEKLKQAGAIILGKVTLGELGGGDTHGTLFGSSRNPYDPERTVGGSSGGSGAAVSANFCTLALGQEGYASIRRPSAWNGVVGMRPTPGLVSRGGVWGGWPGRVGSIGPMTRTVEDLAKLLDVIVAYDPDDPMTAAGVGHIPASYKDSLQADGLQGVRVGVLRTPMGYTTEPETDDFRTVTRAFDRSVAELAAAGATLVDPIEIPQLTELLAKRAGDGAIEDETFMNWMNRSAQPPFSSYDEYLASPEYPVATRLRNARPAGVNATGPNAHYEYLLAREVLMSNLLKVMADNQLDVIVHKTVEHQPTLIREGVNPPYRNQRGAPHINTFLIYVSSITVPAGLTTDGLPTGITFLGRPYSEPDVIKYAFAYEQSTMHRVPPPTTPAL